MPEMGGTYQMIRALLSDLYCTLIDIRTDEGDPWTYETLARYLGYHGVHIGAGDLRREYSHRIHESLSQSTEKHPETDVHAVFGSIMHDFGKKIPDAQSIIDVSMLFRSLTIRRFSLFPHVGDSLAEISKMFAVGLVSDAQWVFTEPEIRMLDLGRFFRHTVISSRFGFKKPDIRLFHNALNALDVRPDEAVYIGDNPEKDLVGAKDAGLFFFLFGSERRDYGGYVPDGCFYDHRELAGMIRDLNCRLM